MNLNNYSQSNINCRSEDILLKWRRNSNITNCISNIGIIGENNSNGGYIMDKTLLNNNILKDNLQLASTSNELDQKLGVQTTTAEVTTPKVRNYYITLAKESPKNLSFDDSSSDTYDSFHFRETDYCKDTSDTSDSSSYTTEGVATVDVVEYDVASRSPSEDLYSNDSSSGTEDLFIAVAAKAVDSMHHQYDSSTSDFADYESNDDFQRDPELSSKDYWNCIKCKNKQNNPMFRYCERCYQIRKSHFPPRPTLRKNRSTLKKTVKNSNETQIQHGKHRTSLSSISDIEGNIANKKSDISGMNVSKTKFNSENGKMINLKSSSVANRSQLNSAAESSSHDDSDFESDDNGKINTPSKTIPKILKNENNNMSTEESSENEINSINRTKCNINSIANHFSTPKYNNNLKRKCPFQIIENNTKRQMFVNNSSCSSITNLTNNYSSSNNSSLIGVTSILKNDSLNTFKGCDSNMVKNLIKTDNRLELNENFHLKNEFLLRVQKDSGISSSSSTAGTSSSQEYFSSQGTVDFGCSSSHSDEILSTDKKSIEINGNLQINLSEEVKVQFKKESENNSDDTVSSDLDDADYDSFEDETSIKTSQNIDSNINNSKSNETNKDKSENLKLPENNGDYSSLQQHLSEIPLMPSSNEFSPSLRNSIISRSASTYNDGLSLNDSPKSSVSFTKGSDVKKVQRNLTNQNDFKKTPVKENFKSQKNSKNDLCIVCLEEPKNGVFVHSRFLHLCCCYKCAVKIWNKNKKCPVCNLTVKNVMKLFVH